MRIVGPDGAINVELPAATMSGGNALEYSDGDVEFVETAWDGDSVWVWYEGYCAKFSLPKSHGAEEVKEALAPMTGKVVAIPVQEGQSVKVGETLAILEAMKMEYRLEAEMDGTVEEIGAREGELVDLGHVLVRLK